MPGNDQNIKNTSLNNANHIQREKFLSPIYLLIILLVTIFSAELIIMFCLSRFSSLSVLTTAIIDASVLMVLIFPLLYFFWLRPLLSHIKKCRQAEELLAEKSIYLNNILESATEYSIATTDLDFRITGYNPIAEKLFGYSKDEVIGKTVQEIHTKEKVSPERFEKGVENVRLYGEHLYTVVNEREDGIQYIDSRVSGIYDFEKNLVGYALFSKDVTENKKAEKEREDLIVKLQKALNKVKTLSGCIPICASCKNIRDDKGYWNHVEEYVSKHSEAEFTHSICPKCRKELYPNIFKD